MAASPEFEFTELFPLGHDDTPSRLISTDHVRTVETPLGTYLQVDPEALTLITQEAMREIAHFLRPGHLQQLSNILSDPEASDNDRFVALDLLKNSAIAAGGARTRAAPDSYRRARHARRRRWSWRRRGAGARDRVCAPAAGARHDRS